MGGLYARCTAKVKRNRTRGVQINLGLMDIAYAGRTTYYEKARLDPRRSSGLIWVGAEEQSPDRCILCKGITPDTQRTFVRPGTKNRLSPPTKLRTVRRSRRRRAGVLHLTFEGFRPEQTPTGLCS